MKKNLFFAALAVVAMASCAKNEAVDPTATMSVAKSIAIDTFIDRSTKAADATTSSLQSDGFNVIGYRHANVDASISTNTQVTTIMPNWAVSYIDGAWDYANENNSGTVLVWDDTVEDTTNSDQLSFFAYSGTATATYSDTQSDGETAEDKVIPSLAIETSASIATQEDIIAASSLNNVYSDSPSPITLDFNHILTKIGFTAEEGDDTGVDIKLIALTVEFKNNNDGNALKSKGTYYFGDGVNADYWVVSSDSDDALVSTSAEKIASEEVLGSSNALTLSETAQNVTDDDSYIMIIPQELKSASTVMVTATYTVDGGSEKTKTVGLPAMTFEAGTWYTFNLVLADNTVRFSSAIKVSSWNGDSYEL